MTHDGPDRVNVEITDAEVGRPIWFVFGQSQSDGWTASLDGNDLGVSTLVDGYANGWLIVPQSSDASIGLRFAPQQRVNLALALSALAALLCIAIVVVDRRSGFDVESSLPTRIDHSVLHYEGSAPALQHSVVLAGAVLVVSTLVGGLVIGVALGAVAFAGTRDTRARLPIALLPVALLGIAVLYVVAWQIRYGIRPGIEWVTELERAHPVALAAVLALALHPLLTWLWRGRSQRDIDLNGL